MTVHIIMYSYSNWVCFLFLYLCHLNHQENGCTLILLSNSLFSVGATAPFSMRMQVAFVDVEWYFEPSLESGKIFLFVHGRQLNTNIILEAAATTAIFLFCCSPL